MLVILIDRDTVFGKKTSCDVLLIWVIKTFKLPV